MRALLRIAVVWNLPVACSRASADFIFSSPLMNEPYLRRVPDYEAYLPRTIERPAPPSRTLRARDEPL